MDLTSGFVFYLADHAGGKIVVPFLIAHYRDINSDLLGCMINRDRFVDLELVIVDC